MSKKLSIEEINQRLEDKGITVVGEYKSNACPTEVECAYGHSWSPSIANLLSRKDGCPHCAGHSSVVTWTTETINEKIHARGITMVTEYTGKVADKGTFICSQSHTWITTINSILRGRGCKQCHGKTMPLSLEIIQQRYSAFGYTVTGDYTGHGCRLTFTCSNGHTWIGNSGNTRCSSCAKYGFNTDRLAFGYILQFDGFIKYGISNSIQSRLYRHRISNPTHSVVALFEFSTGEAAKQWETLIKTDLGGKYADKQACPDGWTETLPNHLLEQVIEKCSGVSRPIS
jgi:hypothetical protein